MVDEPGDRMISNLINENRFKAYATKDIYFYQHRELFGSTLKKQLEIKPSKMSIR